MNKKIRNKKLMTILFVRILTFKKKYVKYVVHCVIQYCRCRIKALRFTEASEYENTHTLHNNCNVLVITEPAI